MNSLEIRWYKTFESNTEGYMILNVDLFFPCKADKRKVFPLIRQWCSDEQIEELKCYLQERANVLEKYMKICKENCACSDKNTVKKYTAEFKSTKTDYDRTQRNIKWLEGR